MRFQSKAVPALEVYPEADFLNLRHPESSPLAGRLVFAEDIRLLIELASKERAAELTALLEAEK